MKTLNINPVATAVAALILVGFAPFAAARGDPERGEELALTCLGCHGIDGYRNAYPSYRVPMLGGQKGTYVQAALETYRDRTRPHPTMQAQGSSLTDEDVADIVAWIEHSGTASDDVDAETPGVPEVVATQCMACHGTAGANVTPAPPVLSGQYRDYLVHALGQYKDQARGMNVMNSFAAGLAEEDMELIAAFYSSLNGLYTLGTEQRAQ